MDTYVWTDFFHVNQTHLDEFTWLTKPQNISFRWTEKITAQAVWVKKFEHVYVN